MYDNIIIRIIIINTDVTVMLKIYNENTKWIFPEKINIEDIPELVEKFDLYNSQIIESDTIIFDLRKTLDVHSSFIGFLIHAKHTFVKKEKNLILHLSLTLERILTMLEIIEYFSPEIIISVNRKTA